VGTQPRRKDLERWLSPFLAGLGREEQRRWGSVHLKGPILPGERKSVEPMAARPPNRPMKGLPAIHAARDRTSGEPAG